MNFIKKYLRALMLMSCIVILPAYGMQQFSTEDFPTLAQASTAQRVAKVSSFNSRVGQVRPVMVDLSIATHLTPQDLMTAISHNDDATVTRCVNDVRLNVNSRNKVGWTPLHLAAFRGNVAAIEALMEREDLDKNPRSKDGQTPLMFAIALRRVDTVQCLLHHNVDVNVRDNKDGFTPLHQALKLLKDTNDTCYCDIINALLNHKADIGIGCTNYGETPVHRAVNMKYTEFVRRVVAEYTPEDVFKLDRNGLTPLHSAIPTGNSEIVSLLCGICRSQDLNVRDNFVQPGTAGPKQRTPLHMLVRFNGDNPNAQRDAMQNKTGARLPGNVVQNLFHLMFVQRCLKPDVNLRDGKGSTILHWIAGSGYEELCRILLTAASSEIDFFAQDRYGKIALNHADEMRYQAISTMLRDAMRSKKLAMRGSQEQELLEYQQPVLGDMYINSSVVANLSPYAQHVCNVFWFCKQQHPQCNYPYACQRCAQAHEHFAQIAYSFVQQS